MDRLMVGVSGVRGTIGTSLTPKIACEFGCAFGTMLGVGKTVVLGRDSRMSGEMIRNAISSGLLATGVHVVDLGIVTTPGTALMTRYLDADGGVIVTASHNPRQYNGIKFLQPSGTGLSAKSAGELKKIWESGEFALVDSDHMGNLSRNTRTHAVHTDTVMQIVDVPAIASKRFKVVLDSVNGAGCVVTPALLSQLGCEVKHLNSEPNGDFAHPPEPIKENITELCDAVVHHKAAVGFAQDADADRLAIVDENGEYIGEEYTLALTAAYVLSKRKGCIATNLATSRMVDDIAAQAGCEVLRTPTGEANVVEAIEKNNCIFGGEGGGGAIDPRVVPVRNSLVGIVLVLQYLAETEKTLSELVAEIPAYTMIKTKLPCPEGAAPKVVEQTRKAFADEPEAKFNDADGLRVDLPDSWVCVRASNTEPIMRIMAEAPAKESAEKLVQRVRRIADEIVS